VVQNVSIEFADPSPTNEWVKSFEPEWLPVVKHDAVEWRDVIIGSQRPGAPQLHAGTAEVAGKGSPTICNFKDATLTANGVEQRIARAELRNEAGRPLLVWVAATGEQHMDLFSGEVFIN
jgi:hypothetical protein